LIRYETSTNGGTFKRTSNPIPIEIPTFFDSRNFTSSAQSKGRRCEKIVSLSRISPDGDLYRKLEYQGFQVIEQSKVEQFLEASAETTSGHIEKFEGVAAKSTSEMGTSIELDEEKSKDNHQIGKLRFAYPIAPHQEPVNFSHHFHGVNTYAMSAYQCKEMYSSDTKLEEWAYHNLNRVPCKELVMIVRFPQGFETESFPELVIENQAKERQTHFEQRFKGNLGYYKEMSLVKLQIPYPPFGLKYKIVWKLRDTPPPQGLPSLSLQGNALELSQRLKKQKIPTPQAHKLRDLLASIEEQVRSEFGLGNAHEEMLDLCLMAYDKDERKLGIVAGTFPQGDERWTDTYKYGDGVAGRAFKMNKIRLFVKQLAIQRATPFYYRRQDRKPVRDPQEIPEAVIIACPLSLPNDNRAVYGVLTLSSKRPGSKLVDLIEENLQQEKGPVFQAINKACFEAFWGLD
jgi:hypothetical protein